MGPVQVGPWACAFTLMNSCFGSGILSTPFAFANLGLLFSPLLCVGIGLLEIFTLCIAASLALRESASSTLVRLFAQDRREEAQSYAARTLQQSPA